MSGHERIEQVGFPTALGEDIYDHLRVLGPLVKKEDGGAQKVLKEVYDLVGGLTAVDASVFIREILGRAKEVSLDIGSGDTMRNGLTFGARINSRESYLFRLYPPFNFGDEVVSGKVQEARDMRPSFGEKLVNSILGERTYTSEDTQQFFSSAEIMVRTIAHVVSRKRSLKQPLPIVLSDEKYQHIVGYSLGFRRFPEKSRDTKLKVTDTFFDWGPTAWGLDERNSGMTAYRLYEDLRTLNCVPYAEYREDLKGMLLTDASGNFITFNRIGYVTSKLS